VGFATYVTVACGASLTLVTNVADLCRYTPTRRDLRIGLLTSSVLAVAVTTFVGAYAAAATGELNPFVAVAELTQVGALLVLLLAAIVVQTTAANVTNVYTAGLSLVNAVPALGRFAATLAVAAAAVALSAFPGVIEEAERWIEYLGNVAAPLTGVVLADYLLVKRTRIDVPALFDPAGPYRFAGGVNVAALLAVAAGVVVYSAVPHAWVKVVWGLAAAAAAYLALLPVQQALLARSTAARPETEAA
jgi:purine-cytosine permease-like protein